MTEFSLIPLRSDALRVDVIPFGASLVSVRLKGVPRNLVLGFADPQDHKRIQICAGGLAGPVANRIQGGVAPIDGQDWQMPQNENGQTALHSGPEGTHRLHWNVGEQTDQSVTLGIMLPHGHCGLPGNRELRATYNVDGNTLRLEIEATTDAPTLMNLASHPYWNLDGTADVSGHQLQVAAPHYLPTDDLNLPTGARVPLEGSPFDFTSPGPVPLDPALDVNFCLAEDMRTGPAFAAELRGSDGTTLTVATTAPGLQVYNGTHLPADAASLQDGPRLAPFAGIALEPQHWPNAPHHPDFPQITLRPNETYRQISTFTFSAP